ncbi:hypothetical protein [Micromonospora sp. NPDC049204]|uniref:hypothetical protein n=1 Tax=unclassified Micromonospora TaxID=2617518 RepID=UPI00340D86DA
MDVPAVASAIGQVAGAVLAIPTAFVAYFAYRTAKSSADATSTLTKIEETRLHAELRPQFQATARLVKIPPARSNMVFVSLELVGPLALHCLDEVVVRLWPRFGVEDPGEPYRLLHGDTWQQIGRNWFHSERRGLGVEMSDTWVTAKPHHRPPIKLVLECRFGTHEPWIVPVEVKEIDVPTQPIRFPPPVDGRIA